MKLNCDGLLSNVAFNFNVRHYKLVGQGVVRVITQQIVTQHPQQFQMHYHNVSGRPGDTHTRVSIQERLRAIGMGVEAGTSCIIIPRTSSTK